MRSGLSSEDRRMHRVVVHRGLSWKRTSKRTPLFFSLVSSIVPPKEPVTRFMIILKPKPVPPRSRAVV